ncbi:MAG: hydroxyphenylacetyl-CoA thioesterase PaaI [Kiloniellales bacterium]
MAVDEGAPVEELAQQIAETVGRVMIERDQLAQALGIELKAIRPGRVRLTMAVRQDMANAHGACHGGVIFTLADTAFGYAGNATNQTTVALSADIRFVAPVHAGDRLTAEAEERSLRGRIGVYDVTVTNHDGELVALFRGLAYRLDREVVPDITVAT